MKAIKLSNCDEHTIVDDDIFEKYGHYHFVRNGRYVTIFLKEKGFTRRYALHRLILNAKDGEIVDHINRNRYWNTRDNLRLCTAGQNARNRSRSKTAVGFRGVYQRGNSGRYYTGVSLTGRWYHIGTFDTPIEAAVAYDKKAKELHGEFACLNFPDGEPVQEIDLSKIEKGPEQLSLFDDVM